MLKREITFQDLDGNVLTENFYFNLTVPEVTDLAVDMDGNMNKYYESIVERRDAAAMLREFKKLVSLAYGERGDDGKTFYKEDPDTGRPLGAKFLQTDAYSVLFMEMFGPESSDEAFSDFIRAILPKDLVNKLEDVNLPAGENGEKPLEQYSRDELLALSQEDFDKLVGTDSNKWSQETLQVAFQRKATPAKAIEG